MANGPVITLPTGKQLPQIGFGNGTALYNQDPTQSVRQAIQGGYTLIDTAEAYANSQFVGKVLQEHDKKQTLTVVAKVTDTSRIRQAALEEREKLKLDKLDVLLLHSPPRGAQGKPSNVEAWQTLEQLKDEGVAAVIGVSNWLAGDIEEVLASNPKHAIEINEIEHHPLLIGAPKQQKLLKLQKQKGIATMIYGSLLPITQFADQQTSLHKTLESIAQREKGWTPATVLFKWASQTTPFGEKTDGTQDGILITTTNKVERIAEYLSLFNSRRLTDEEVAQVTQAGKEQEVRKKYMIPFFDGRPE